MARGPVRYTCGTIDTIITYVQDAVDARNDIEDLKDLLGTKGLLETIRNANEALRSWGAEEEDRANALETERGILQERLDDAEREINNLRKELSAMEF